jgi:hypothetical protein
MGVIKIFGGVKPGNPAPCPDTFLPDEYIERPKIKRYRTMLSQVSEETLYEYCRTIPSCSCRVTDPGTKLASSMGGICLEPSKSLL